MLQGSSLQSLPLCPTALCVWVQRGAAVSLSPAVGKGQSGHRLMCLERHKTEGEVWPEWKCCSSGGLIPRLERLSTMWNGAMNTSLQLSLRKVPPFSPVSSCISETCASPEQLHPLSWWKALTCVRTSTAIIPLVFPFHFSRGVLLPSYLLFLSSSISDCWRLKFYLFGF